MQSKNTQPCFRCLGRGQVYPFEGDLGEPETCPGCKGAKTIESTYYRCIKCEGTGKCYPYENKSGLPFTCTLCNDKGYTIRECMKCVNCQGEGKEYPFPNKMGNPRECNVCKGRGFFMQSELMKMNTAPSPLNNYNNATLSSVKTMPVFNPNMNSGIYIQNLQMSQIPNMPSNLNNNNSGLETAYQFGGTFYPTQNKQMAQGYFNNLIRPFQQNINTNFSNIPPQSNVYPMYPY